MTRLEYGVQLRPQHMVMTAGDHKAAAQAKVEESGLSTAVVMVREHDVSEWVPLAFYDRYVARTQGDTEELTAKRRRLYEQSQYDQLRNEVWRLRVQLNTEWDSIPLVLIRDLPTEWRTMTSLRVDDVARELESIIRQRLERHTVRRTLPEAKVLTTEGDVRVRAGRFTRTFPTLEHAMAQLAMAKAAVAEFERRDEDA